MKILIIDDEYAVADLTAELLYQCDRQARRIKSVLVAYSLEQALDVLDDLASDQRAGTRNLTPGIAVLCDGHFPERPSGEAHPLWPAIAGECARRGARCVIYSGDAQIVERARAAGLAAFAKPSDAYYLYVALTAPDAGHRGSGSGQDPLAENAA